MVGQQTIKWTKLSEDTTAINVYYPYFVAKHHHDHGHTVAGKQTNMSFYEHNGWPGTGPGKHGHHTIVIMIINFSIKLTSDHTKSDMTLGLSQTSRPSDHLCKICNSSTKWCLWNVQTCCKLTPDQWLITMFVHVTMCNQLITCDHRL